MPEIKHNFTTGKMNKDLDERLVQNGEYRDAMNIQVSTSDDSDVGTVQNILGNSLIHSIDYLTDDAVCIASVADEKNNSIYWFVYDNNNVVEQSFIFKYDKKNVKVVFVDLDNTVLKFSKQHITAINIIDGLMFFTDGINEPKKINIQDCIDYTVQNGSQNTQILIEKGQAPDPDITSRLLETHITVIKKAPFKAPSINYNYFREPGVTYAGVITTSKSQAYSNSFLNSSNGQIHDFTNISAGDSFTTIIENDIKGSNEFTLNWKEGTSVVIKEFGPGGKPPSLPLQSYALKGYIEEWQDNIFSNQSLLLPIKYTAVQPGWNEVTIRQDYTFNGNQYNKLSSRPWHVGTQSGEEIEENKQYKINFTLYADGNGDLEGKLTVRLFSKAGGYGSGSGLNNYVIIKQFDSLSTADVGEYEYEFTPQNYPGGWTSSPSWTNYASCLQFEAKTDNSSGSPVVFKGGIKDFTITRLDAQIAKVKIKITSKDNSSKFSVTEGNSLNYVIDTYESETGIFEDKMARFAFRYKYKDNEYSSFSPFTNVVFSPGNFNYNPIEAYNSGMTNNVKDITVGNFDYRMPADVKSIDILYKEESSPSVYVVDTIKSGVLDMSYSITSESVKNILAEEQFLRTYDNVPKSAKTQEIIGNRLVYGNYKENYDLLSINDNGVEEEFEAKLETKIVSSQNPTTLGAPSIKSSRKYQVGVVYSDEYGRQTPVLTNSEASVDLDIDRSTSINKLSVLIKSLGHPVNMDYFKFYIKDNSGEYYNIAMDRWYDAEDGNVWLAFPSSDRSKIEIDDFLILKKGIGVKNTAVIKDNKYKVIDIQNEAPENIKREDKFISKKSHRATSLLFVDIPTIGNRTFSVNFNKFSNGTLSNLHENFTSRDISTKYLLKFNRGSIISDTYEITDIVLDDSATKFTFTVDKEFKSDVAQFSDDPLNIGDATEILDNTNLSLFISNIENSPKFDGRFFVKIFKDANYTKFIESNIIESPELDEYVTNSKTTKRLYYCKSTEAPSLQSFNGPMYHGNALRDDGAGDIALGDWWGLGSTADYSDPTYDSTFPIGLSCTQPPGSFLLGTRSDNACLRGFMEAAKNVIRTVGDYSYAVDFGFRPDSTSVADENYNHKSWLNYIAWKAWFRGINLEQRPLFSNVGRVDKIDLEANREDTFYEDVWFINEARNTKDMPYLVGNPRGPGGHVVSSTYPTANSDATGPGGYDQKGGWSSWSEISHLDIAFGGIEINADNLWSDTKWSRSNYQSWYHRPNYFDLQSHPVYGEKQGDFVKKLSAGSQFRFRQDPSGTIYTIEDVHIDYMLMYDNIEESVDHNPANNGNHFKGQLRVAKGEKFKSGGGADQYGNEFKSDGVTLATDETESDIVYTPNPFFDAANYAINYKLMLNKPVAWNPVESHGSPINGGYNITVPATATPVGSATGGLFTITTTSIKGLDATTGKTMSIEIGMVLEGYIDATDGATKSLSKKAVVHDISFLSPNYTIKFKAYDGNDDNLDSANAVGNIPNIVAADQLIFRQYSMNGMCPNSAKNLNYFREGGESLSKSGVAPLGYDIEFLDIDFSEDSEYLVPSDPAVWETEHKESVDIDIYYEASDSIPILTSNQGFLADLIPVGSIVEHLDSNGVPFETKVLSINGNVLTTDKEVNITYPPYIHQQERDYNRIDFE